MIHIAILQHTPDQCPGHNKGLFDDLQTKLPRLPEFAGKYNVEVRGMYAMVPSHKTIAVVEAPDADAVSRFLIEAGITAWNHCEVAPAYSPQEALAMAQL